MLCGGGSAKTNVTTLEAGPATVPSSARTRHDHVRMIGTAKSKLADVAVTRVDVNVAKFALVARST